MSRKPLNKTGTAFSGEENTGKLKKAGIFVVDSSGKLKIESDSKHLSEFLLNPDSYNETKTANWAAQQIPGNSDPVHQYMGGGPRIVTFDALVTRDTSHLDANQEESLASNLKDAAFTAVGAIASSFAGISVPPIGDLFGTNAKPGNRLSIANRLSFYRSLLYPTYTANYASMESSPPLVVLTLGSTLTDVNANETDSVLNKAPSSPYVPVWVVTSLNIKITKQLPNLDPMEAIVTFTLHEYSVAPTDRGSFVQLPGFKTSGGFSAFGISF